MRRSVPQPCESGDIFSKVMGKEETARGADCDATGAKCMCRFSARRPPES